MSKSSLDELIAAADNLCSTLEKEANNERKFCADVQLRLEQYSWELYRTANDLRQIKEIYGG